MKHAFPLGTPHKGLRMIGKLQQQLADSGRFLEKRPAVAVGLAIAWVLVIGGIAFVWHLGSIGLVDETEPLFAEAARQMQVTGDWITPYFNGETRFDKPPLIYWLMALSYQVIGVNEWAVRLPSALSALSLMGITFYGLYRFGIPIQQVMISPMVRGLAAAIGAAVLATNLLVVVWARTGVSDMLLTACIGWALWCFFLGYAAGEAQDTPARSLEVPANARSHPGLPWYLASYIWIGLGILTKGPIALVLPGLIIGTFLLYVGRCWRVLREMRPLWGLGLVLLISVPWHVLVFQANGWAFVESFFGYHNVERFTQVVNRHSAPWYFYFIVVAVGTVPWSVFLPRTIAHLQFWKRSLWRHQPRSQQLGLFALFWFVNVFGFFTIAVTKLPSYVLPLVPAIAILTGLWWAEQMTQPSDRHWFTKLSAVGNGLVFLALVWAISQTPTWLAGDRNMPLLPQMLEQSGALLIGEAIALTAAMVGLALVAVRQIRWLWLVNMLAFLLLLMLAVTPAMFILDAQRQLPLRNLSEVIVATRRPGEEVIMVGFKMPSVVFYTQQPVTFDRNFNNLFKHLPTAFANGSTVLVLGDQSEMREKLLPQLTHEYLGQAGPYELVRLVSPAIQ